ncbi:hypothetical protein F5Y12DRAFT_791972 [Xylaria sp. FL1777]|nr:hypothetical protein F5Y12DRAFT_791972 [Xylaria sp. FL1777]
MKRIESIPSSPGSEKDKRIAFLSKAGLGLPPEVPCLVKLPYTDFNRLLPEHADAARAFLVEYRKNGPKHKPEEAKHDIFRLLSQKRKTRDEALWAFEKPEVAHTFHNLLSHEPLLPAGIAQALLSHVSLASLDELWSHFNDRKLEKRMNSYLRRAGVPSVSEIPWLDHVTRADNVEYVRLMCQAGLAQEALDRAFSIALERQSMEVMKMLLAFGATTAACEDGICVRIQLGDASLARLLLSAHPAAVSLSTWRRCFSEGIVHRGKNLMSILLQSLSQRPGIVCGCLLLRALETGNFQVTAVILAYASSESRLGDFGQSACSLVSEIQSIESRYDFFVLLAGGGLVADYVSLRKELMADIEARHFPLVRLLVDADVALDVEPYNTVTYLVSKMDLDMLEWVQGGTYYTPAALALRSAPESTPESLLLRLVTLLAPRVLSGEPLDAFLVLAAHRQYAELAQMLLDLGASVEHDMACAIKTAVKMVDLSMLKILLQGPCSSNVLSSVLPVAMKIQSRLNRDYVVNALLCKGVIKQELGISLQTAVAEAGDIDSNLVRVLVEHGAPVEGIGDDTTNALLQAARRCNSGVVQLLSLAQPSLETFSKAVPIAFRARDSCGYDAVLETLKLLLEHGANGTPVHETLLAASIQDHQQDMVRVLVQYGADANFANGAPFDLALKAADGRLLEILCRGCPPSQASIVSVLYRAVDPLYYSLEALELLLGSGKSTGAALDASWDADKLRGNPNLNTIVPCFLRHGLDVNFRDGALVCFAVQETDINLLKHVISSGPNMKSLTEAFKLVTVIDSRQIEIEMMSILLNSAQSVEIGQSTELLKQTRTALFRDDFDGMRLLLQHKAAVDFDKGIAVRMAASAGHLKVLKSLLRYMPAVSTLHNACLAAAASDTLSSDRKRLVFISLLDAQSRELTEADHLSHLLAESVRTLPDHEELPALLIQRGAKAQLETLTVAMRISSQPLFKTLADEQNGITITEAYDMAWKAHEQEVLYAQLYT